MSHPDSPFALQESAVSSHDLLPAIACELAKALADIDDRIVRQRWVCEAEVLLRNCDRLYQAIVRLWCVKGKTIHIQDQSDIDW